MKDKKYKYIYDVVEEYLHVKEEQEEITLQIAKNREKFDGFIKDHLGRVIKDEDAQHAFKIHQQLKKYEENEREMQQELTEIEYVFKEFLKNLKGSKISIERKDDSKSRTTHLFWLDGEDLKTNVL